MRPTRVSSRAGDQLSRYLDRSRLLPFSFAALAAVTDSAVHPPPAYDTFVPPGAGGSYADAAFGTSVKRLSDAVSIT